MPINETIKSGEEAHDIFRILLASSPADKQEEEANWATFGDTLLTVFAHDKYKEDSGKRWLTPECAQTIYDIAQQSSSERLRAVAIADIAFVGMREQHLESALKTLTNILKNPEQPISQRGGAAGSMIHISQYVPEACAYVVNTLASVISDKETLPEVRSIAAVEIFMSGRAKPELIKNLSTESVDSLITTLKEEGDLKVRHYAGILLNYAGESSEQHRDKTEPLAELIAGNREEFMRLYMRQDPEPSPPA